jgi:hypothetical protein
MTIKNQKLDEEESKKGKKLGEKRKETMNSEGREVGC